MKDSIGQVSLVFSDLEKKFKPYSNVIKINAKQISYKSLVIAIVVEDMVEGLLDVRTLTLNKIVKLEFSLTKSWCLHRYPHGDQQPDTFLDCCKKYLLIS